LVDIFSDPHSNVINTSSNSFGGGVSSLSNVNLIASLANSRDSLSEGAALASLIDGLTDSLASLLDSTANPIASLFDGTADTGADLPDSSANACANLLNAASNATEDGTGPLADT
jgi:hypothetical protein